VEDQRSDPKAMVLEVRDRDGIRDEDDRLRSFGGFRARDFTGVGRRR
jgi:hypothetical protein